MRVAVYGNLIHDKVVTVDSKIHFSESNQCIMSDRVGGIANFARAVEFGNLFDFELVSSVGDDYSGNFVIDKLQSSPISNINVVPGAKTSSAVNLVQRDIGLRTGFVDWGVCATVGMKPIDADWHHLMYLDRMNISDILAFSGAGIVSADLCDSHHIDSVLDKIAHVDVLFCSSVDHNRHRDLNSCKLPFKSIFVMHQPGFCSVSYKHSGLEFDSTEVVPGLDVLGAGDYFAANCIASIINTTKVDIQAVHDNTLKLLRAQSNV